MQREGNSLSPTIRQAWDHGSLRTLVKNSPARATNAHIALSCHITKPELLKLMKDTEAVNGFANRFLWLLVRRSRLLPDGGRDLDLSPLGVRLGYSLAAARNIGAMKRTEAASRLWHEVYPRLTDERPGLFGAVTGRAEAQTLRLSMLYALLAGQEYIAPDHLQAALALWDYAEASAQLIFGGDADPLPGLILAKLREAPDGMSRTELHNAFNRNLPAGQLLAALARLRDRGDVIAEKSPSTAHGGRPAERWKCLRRNERTKEPTAGGEVSSFFRSFVDVSSKADGDGEVMEL